MNFKQLELEDKKVLDKYLKPYKFKTYEYSFTNLFIWRKAYDIQYAILNGVLIIKKMDSKGQYHFMQPIGYTMENLKLVMGLLIQYAEKFNLKFLFQDVEEDFVELLKEVYPLRFNIKDNRDVFDYIYESSWLINLSGRKLKNQRNHYNQFIKNNNYSLTHIKEDEITKCVEFFRQWYTEKEYTSYDLNYEFDAIEDLLKYRHILNLEAMAVYIDEKFSAFTIGEKVSEEMAIIHIEKADPKIRGLYTFINKTFAEKYFKDVKFINREEDLGIEGLRVTKMAYKPIKLEPKYSVINITNNY